MGKKGEPQIRTLPNLPMPLDKRKKQPAQCAVIDDCLGALMTSQDITAQMQKSMLRGDQK